MNERSEYNYKGIKWWYIYNLLIVFSSAPIENSRKKKKQLFVAFPWVETSTGPGGFMICVFIIWREHPKAHRKCFFGEAGILTTSRIYFMIITHIDKNVIKLAQQFKFLCKPIGCEVQEGAE